MEKLIWERVNQIGDLDDFLEATLQGGENKVFVASKQQIKKSKKIHSQYEPDFLGFNPKQRKCYIIEVKDGDQFDTKKAAGERQTLYNFRNDVSSVLSYSTAVYICSFNARNRDEIVLGLKNQFSKEETLTGKEMCDLFGIDYQEIVKNRTSDQRANLRFFIVEILKIPAIKKALLAFLKKS